MYFDPQDTAYYNPATDRKVAVITGGNSGIGFYTVLHLYLHGYIVYVLGRTSSKVEKAFAEIKKEADRRRSVVVENEFNNRYLGELHYLEIDLLSLKSVENAALKTKILINKIDLLILNAGIGGIPFALTSDKFEIQMQTNYVAHFLLTQKLLDLCKGRVVYVSSIANFFEFFPFDRSWLLNYKPDMVFTWFRYAMAKTSGIQYMKLLALKHPEIQFYSVHPGFVMNTNFFIYWTRIPIIGVFFWVLFQVFGHFFGCSNEEGSYATLRCSLSEEVQLEENGSYFTTGGKLAKPGRVALDKESMAQTWLWTIKELKERGFDGLD